MSTIDSFEEGDPDSFVLEVTQTLAGVCCLLATSLCVLAYFDVPMSKALILLGFH